MEISLHIADVLEATKLHKVRILEDEVVNKMAEAGEHDAPYEAVFGDVSKIIDAARDSAASAVNAARTTGYWLVCHRIVEFEQSREERPEYGAVLIERLAEDLTGAVRTRLFPSEPPKQRLFYLSYPPGQPTRGCCRSRTRAPAMSMRPRRCEEDGRSASSTGRSVPSFTSGLPSPRTSRHADKRTERASLEWGHSHPGAVRARQSNDSGHDADGGNSWCPGAIRSDVVAPASCTK